MSSTPSVVSKFCKADVGGEVRVLELVNRMSIKTYESRSPLLKARPFPTLQSSPSGVLPVNTLLFFRDREEQDWLDDERQEPEDCVCNDVIKVSIDRAAFEQPMTDDEVESASGSDRHSRLPESDTRYSELPPVNVVRGFCTECCEYLRPRHSGNLEAPDSSREGSKTPEPKGSAPSKEVESFLSAKGQRLCA
ncbi:MAG: hypothetical protein LQ352_002945 [Teloschistes flavicans]|nr:MAG: hypothetical protein LQ352_002945 [Teloschistes flavicans]